MHVLDRRDIGVLRRRRARDRDQRLAGRVGNQVQMKITAGALGHCLRPWINAGYLWNAGEEATPSGRVQASAGTGCKYVPTAAPGTRFGAG